MTWKRRRAGFGSPGVWPAAPVARSGSANPGRSECLRAGRRRRATQPQAFRVLARRRKAEGGITGAGPMSVAPRIALGSPGHRAERCHRAEDSRRSCLTRKAARVEGIRIRERDRRTDRDSFGEDRFGQAHDRLAAPIEPDPPALRPCAPGGDVEANALFRAWAPAMRPQEATPPRSKDEGPPVPRRPFGSSGSRTRPRAGERLSPGGPCSASASC